VDGSFKLPTNSGDVRDDEYLTPSAVADLLKVGVRTLRRMVKLGQFPQPIRHNRKLVRWRRQVVMSWFNDPHSPTDR